MNSRKEEYDTLVKRMGELEDLIKSAKCKETDEKNGRRKQITEKKEASAGFRNSACTSTHSASSKSGAVVEGSTSSGSSTKSVQMNSKEIRNQLHHTEQKILSLKKTLSQLKADKSLSSSTDLDRQSKVSSGQKGKLSTVEGTKARTQGHCKAGDPQDNSVRHAENEHKELNMVNMGKNPSVTSASACVLKIKHRNSKSAGLDHSKDRMVKVQTLHGETTKNKKYGQQASSMKDPTANSVSATPISDLIARNLQSQKLANKLSSESSSKYVVSKKLSKPLSYSDGPGGTKSGSVPSSSLQRGATYTSHSMKSITPITDLLDQNMAVQRQMSQKSRSTVTAITQQPQRARSTVTSITPISDLITRNIENSSPKKHNSNRRASVRRTPKGPKFPDSLKWSRTQNVKSSKTPASSDKKVRNAYRSTKSPVLPGQMSWTRRSSAGENVHSFKSPAEKLAYIIKNKYKLVKDNPPSQGGYHGNAGHVVQTRYSLRRGVQQTSRKQLVYRTKRHGGQSVYFGSNYGKGRGGLKTSRMPHFKARWSSYPKSYHSKVNYRVKNLQKNWMAGKQRFKLDRRGDPVYSAPSILDGHRLVMIQGTVYRTSGKGLISTKSGRNSGRRNSHILKRVQSFSSKTILVRGVKFQMDSNGKTLKRLGSGNEKGNGRRVSRIDIAGVTYIQKTPDLLEKSTNSNSRFVASQVLHRSIRTATARFRKDNTKLAQKYCKFYNRFGRCRRGENCQYIHDPAKIAVCTRFLRGTCNVTDCPFSHKVDKDKMPVCSYFLKGVCNRDNCPYLHVNVDRDAKVCSDFLNGFCPFGEKCKKKHTRVCPVFSRTGRCPDGKTCRLIHRQTRKRCRSSLTKSTDSISRTSEERVQDKTETEDDIDNADIPFKMRKLPTYISLAEYTDTPTDTPTKGSKYLRLSQESRKKAEGTDEMKTETAKMKIKPQF